MNEIVEILGHLLGIIEYFQNFRMNQKLWGYENSSTNLVEKIFTYFDLSNTINFGFYKKVSVTFFFWIFNETLGYFMTPIQSGT